MAGLLLFGALSARFAILSPQGRLLVEAAADGLTLGRIGKLKVEGVEGDLMRDFRLRRLTIMDEKGVWLEARALRVSWRYMPLLTRKLHIDCVSAEQVTLIRWPTLSAKTTAVALPINIQIDAVKARLEMLPDFSVRRGDFDVEGNLAVRRADGGFSGRLKAISRLHTGDHLAVDLAFLKGEPRRLVAEAVESRGGAMAGALGLPVDSPFELHARAGGKESNNRFHADLTSGNDQPVKLNGVWTQNGGQGTGRISLTASSLTRDLARRLGPEVQVNFSGFKDEAGFFSLAARVDMANLTLTAAGLGDPKNLRLGPAGMDIVATSPALSRITGGPNLGAARVMGRLTGKVDNWRFDGSGAVSTLDLGDYRLATASGPLTLSSHKGELELTVGLRGSGGQGGQGSLFAVFGDVPKVSLDLIRLADGRLALKNLEAQGRGLTLSAHGGRSLFGGLTLKGGIEASNLTAKVGPQGGVRGGALVSWTAAQDSPNKPWALSLDGRGRGLVTGIANLDRLLGPTPRLTARGAFDAGRLTLAGASLDGATLHVTSAGRLDLSGEIAFDLDWSAEGPFRLGPLDLTGRAKGTGTVSGTLSEPKADLAADFDAIDIPKLPLTAAHLTLALRRDPKTSLGTFGLRATSAYGPASARANFGLSNHDLNLTDLLLDAGGVRATGDLTLRPGDGTRADLNLTIGSGVLIDGGLIRGHARITDAPGGPRAELALNLANVVLPGHVAGISTGRLTADGPLSHLPYDLKATGVSQAGQWSLTGGGLAAPVDDGYRLGFEGSGRSGGTVSKQPSPLS